VAYVRNSTWVDNVTAIDSARMENIENGIYTASLPDPPPLPDDIFEGTVNRWHGNWGPTQNYAPLNATIAFAPMYFGHTVTWHEVAVVVKTVGVQSPTGYYRIGLYDHTSADIMTMIHDFGAIDGLSTGQKSIAGSWTITKGWHFLCVAVTGWSTVPQIAGSTYPTQPALASMGSATNTVPENHHCYRGGWVTGTVLDTPQGVNASAYFGYPNFGFRRTS